MPQGDQNGRRAFALYAAAGFQFVGAVGGLSVLGWWFDGRLGTTPWLAVAGLVLGSVGGFWNLWRILKLIQTNDERRETSDE